MFAHIFVLAAIGLAVSVYGAIVENRIKKDASYKPACDISANISCSRPLSSKYNKILNIPTTIIGIFFYLTMMMLAMLEYVTLLWWGALAAVLFSIVYAYILFFKIRTTCLLCITIYLINFALLYLISLY